MRTSIYFKRFIIQAFSDVGFVREAMCLFFLARAENIATAVLKHISLYLILLRNFQSEIFVLIRNTCDGVISAFRGIVPVFTFIGTIIYVLRDIFSGLNRQSNPKNTFRKIVLTLKRIA